jgi:putative transposase
MPDRCARHDFPLASTTDCREVGLQCQAERRRAATDFFIIEVWGLRGLVTFYLLIVIELSTRRVHLAGNTPNPNTALMMQIGRYLTAPDGVLAGKRFIVMDRESKFCDAFLTTLSESGTEPLRLPPRSPNLNAYCERLVRSIKSEFLEKIVFFDERSLRRAATSFLDHHHEERNHQGLDNQLIESAQDVGHANGTIQCRKRLGGILRYYFRKAAKKVPKGRKCHLTELYDQRNNPVVPPHRSEIGRSLSCILDPRV